MSIVNDFKTMIINGIKFFVRTKGADVKIRTNKNGKTSVTVNGDVITDCITGNRVVIQWEGDLAKLDCNTAEINGSVYGDVDGNTVRIKGDVTGNIDANTVSCGNVGGDIDANTVKVKK